VEVIRIIEVIGVIGVVVVVGVFGTIKVRIQITIAPYPSYLFC
jgi:hypothetical protein